MSSPISDLAILLRSLEPFLNEGVYVFSTLAHEADLSGLAPIATVREREGITVVLEEEAAKGAGLPVLFRTAWITLTVHSDLQAIGLTAAFAGALGQAGISCNVIAGAFHDHLFVPIEAAQAAMAALRELQRSAV